MTNQTSYAVMPSANAPADLLRDMACDKPFVIIRTSRISTQAWSFHDTEKAAKAAVRRNRARDIVTR